LYLLGGAHVDARPILRVRAPPLERRKNMITVIAHYRAQTDKADEVRALLARHSRASAAEDGCIQFLAHQATEDPALFALYETYEDDAAFEAHRRTDHFRVNIEQTLVPMLIEREWRVYGAPLDDR
jgi:(4S)-4-hydroxy-5-phosphonooxypentane-2,3-dione isomerase